MVRKIILFLTKTSKGKPGPSPASLFVLGFFCILITFISDIALRSFDFDFRLATNYFLIGRDEFMMILALIFLAFSAFYSVYPRISGRWMNPPLAYAHFGLTLIGVYLLLWPVRHYPGLAGMPRRYFEYRGWLDFSRYRHMGFNTLAVILLIVAQVLFLVNLIYSAVRGKRSQNPSTARSSPS